MSMDWPVAQIPTTPLPNHPGGILMPLRWEHHGDLRILVDEDDLDIFVAAADLYALAELEGHRANHPHPNLRPLITWARHAGDPLVDMYALVDAVAVLEHAPTHQTHELLVWLRNTLPYVLRDEVLDNAVGLESFCDAYTVQQAAMILDRDPAISIGRNSLFTHLEHIAWAHRDLAGNWQPTSYAVRHQVLTIRNVIIRAHTRAAAQYPQIYVTKTGLTELRVTLHALNTQQPAQAAPEALPIPE